MLILVLLILSVGMAVLSAWLGIPRLLFVAQIGILTAVLCAIPAIVSIVVGEYRPVLRMALEILLFVASIVGFGLWVFGLTAIGIWIAYAVVLVSLLEVGGHGIEWYLDRSVQSLSDSRVGSNMRGVATAIEQMFHRERILYVAVPIGLLAGAIVALLGKTLMVYLSERVQ